MDSGEKVFLGTVMVVALTLVAVMITYSTLTKLEQDHAERMGKMGYEQSFQAVPGRVNPELIWKKAAVAVEAQ